MVWVGAMLCHWHLIGTQCYKRPAAGLQEPQTSQPSSSVKPVDHTATYVLLLLPNEGDRSKESISANEEVIFFHLSSMLALGSGSDTQAYLYVSQSML